MRTEAEIRERIRILTEDQLLSTKNMHQALGNLAHGQAAQYLTVVACAGAMIATLKWAMEESEDSPTPPAASTQQPPNHARTS